MHNNNAALLASIHILDAVALVIELARKYEVLPVVVFALIFVSRRIASITNCVLVPISLPWVRCVRAIVYAIRYTVTVCVYVSKTV